jgi:hypothetical protein
MAIKILGIAGSLRKGSFNRMALRAAQGLVPAGASLEIFDLPDLPGFNQDNERTPPAAVTEMKAKIRAADCNSARDARVQLLHVRRVEECHRLGLAPLRR